MPRVRENILDQGAQKMSDLPPDLDAMIKTQERIYAEKLRMDQESAIVQKMHFVLYKKFTEDMYKIQDERNEILAGILAALKRMKTD